MRLLVVGSGGREHALAWRLEREGAEVLVAPGNGGTAQRNRPVAAMDGQALLDVARRERVDLTIVGPETPLADGLVDRFAAAGLAIFGPTRAAARLEWSKAWTKDFLVRHAIPTARSEVVQSESAARQAIARTGLPVVLKADGLAAGKGVFVVHTPAQLEVALDRLFRARTVGDAANEVLIEECLVGPELSVLAFTDGARLAVMPPARDYKRLLDGDGGPNTGGMGGYTWPSYASPGVLAEIEQTVLRPTLDGLQREGIAYRGVLYAGLMLTDTGPRVLEFNSRFGDPECQLLMPLLSGSLTQICASVAAGELRPEDVRWTAERTYGVVVAAPGYPEAPRLDQPLGGLDRLPDDVLAFHAGTRRDPLDGRLLTSGGRVLTLVGTNRQRVYAAADQVVLSGKQLRRDIGQDFTARAADRQTFAGAAPTSGSGGGGRA